MKLYGNIIGNPVPRPDWNQTDSTAADFIKNKPNIADIEAAANNALPKTGGTILGDLHLGDGTNTAQYDLYIKRAVNEVFKSGRLFWGKDGNLKLQAASDGTVFNYLDLREDSTEFLKPVSIPGGGTGAGTPEDALSNLGGLSKAGGTMNGNISMNGGKYSITGLAAPVWDNDAVRKSYVDGKHQHGAVTLSAAGWSSGAQEVSVSGILATDMPHWSVVYGTNKEAEKEAFALVDQLETADGKFTFTCFGEVPSVDLTIQWEVNR